MINYLFFDLNVVFSDFEAKGSEINGGNASCQNNTVAVGANV